jgi:hypothetical protein
MGWNFSIPEADFAAAGSRLFLRSEKGGSDLDEEKTVEWRLPAHHAETICLCFFSGAWERNIEWDA